MRVVQFSPVSIIPSALQTHLHLHVALTRRKNGEAWRPSKKQRSFGNRGTLNRKVLSLFSDLTCRGPYFIRSKSISNFNGKSGGVTDFPPNTWFYPVRAISPVLMYTLILLSSEGHVGEAWKPSANPMIFRVIRKRRRDRYSHVLSSYKGLSY